MSEKINDLDLEQVDGGAAKNPKSWENFAKGTFVRVVTFITDSKETMVLGSMNMSSIMMSLKTHVSCSMARLIS